ncbi:MAG: hypothetical protein WCF18_15420 [Chthoniobacteraceae bacterium]
MKKRLFTAILIVSACLLPGCATEEPGMRAGIQDPIERHPKSFWQSAKELPRNVGRTFVHAADGNTRPSNDSL